MSSETEREAAKVFFKAHADWLAQSWSQSPEGRQYKAEFERHVAALDDHPAEPPRTVYSPEPGEERLIRLSDALAVVPGGGWCDPQHVADSLRGIPAAAPLTDEQIAQLWRDACQADLPTADLVVRFARDLLASQP